MAEKSKNTQHISLRMPLKELSVIDTYAAANDLSRAQAVLHFVRQGIAAETGEKPATKSDLVAFAATLTKAIESQPVSVQLPPQDTAKAAQALHAADVQRLEAPSDNQTDPDAWKAKGLFARILKR